MGRGVAGRGVRRVKVFLKLPVNGVECYGISSGASINIFLTSLQGTYSKFLVGGQRTVKTNKQTTSKPRTQVYNIFYQAHFMLWEHWWWSLAGREAKGRGNGAKSLFNRATWKMTREWEGPYQP